MPLLIKARCNALTSVPWAPIFRPTDGFGAAVAAGAAAGAAAAAVVSFVSFAMVAASALPVTGSPFQRWKLLTAICVEAP